MWETFLETKLRGQKIDVSRSFFVGDAAGRLEEWKPGRRKDHANTDKKFSMNIGLPFFTPESFFLREPETDLVEPLFVAKDSIHTVSTPIEMIIQSLLDHQEAIVFVGSPASGKSTFFTRYLSDRGFIHVNQVCNDMFLLFDNLGYCEISTEMFNPIQGVTVAREKCCDRQH